MSAGRKPVLTDKAAGAKPSLVGPDESYDAVRNLRGEIRRHLQRS